MAAPDEAAGHIRVRGNLGALFTPHCARIHPAKLVRGLARAVERLGVPIYEHTEVTEIGPGKAGTPYGVVTAEVVVARHRGLYRGASRQAAFLAAGVLLDGGHRAARVRVLGGDWLER